MRRQATALLVMLAACGPGQSAGPRDTGLDLLELTRVDPGLLLPGTRIVLTGKSFVDPSLGQSRMHLAGTLGGAAVDAVVAATYVSPTRLEVPVDDGFVAGLGAPLDGAFQGTVTVEVASTVDGKLHSSNAIGANLDLAAAATPRLDAVGDGVSFVNQPIAVTGDGFLLGGDEGETRAVLAGCFKPAGMAACGPAVSVELPAQPSQPYDRAHLSFPYATTVSGILPGAFDGSLTLENLPPGGTPSRSAARSVHFDIQKPAIFGASPLSASLGQYVVIQGGGFVGGPGASDEATTLGLTGTFTPVGGGAARPLDLELVPEFQSGPVVRYVLDEADPLGHVVNLRTEAGSITGQVRPIVAKGRDRIEGDPVNVQLGVLAVKQVVYVNFLPSYVASLRKFGLRAADSQIRDRVFVVARRDYAGVNMDFRSEPPTDFAEYEQVNLAGPDPNALGLLGYDNSPGKDTDNKRLYDRIGGVNAETQQDGSPGFGGVFTESFFGFSKHPNGLSPSAGDQASPLFDQVFDAFRPDQHGQELTATELAALAPPTLTDGSACPAAKADRAQQVACAVFVLGSMIGTTMTHEIGHSLGLANPYGEGFHNPGDQPNRLMDAGGARTFNERAELMGEGPSVFCDTEYDYLRMLLPSNDPAPAVSRPTCQ